MAINVVASLDEAVPAGVITHWNCRVGDRVRKGEVLGEVETEKANIEVEAPEDGVIEAILVPVGGALDRATVLVRLVPMALGAGLSDLAERAERARVVIAPRTSAPSPEARCRFCHSLVPSGVIACARCGAPL